MIVYLRVRQEERVPASGLLLDWFGTPASSTVTGSVAELTRGLGAPDPSNVDLLRLAVAAYSADKLVEREQQPDRWTRQMRLHVPVRDRVRWARAAPLVADALQFLSNDQWEVRVRQDRVIDPAPTSLLGFDVACLFSGGLDSLVGAMDLLDAGKRVVLVGHYDSNVLAPRQRDLAAELAAAYGTDRVLFRPFFLRPAGARAEQIRALPRARERTTRSRSFLFIAAGGAVASAIGQHVIHVPENGYMSLNVPLEPSRIGACSTRTTHPHFFALLHRALTGAGVALEVRNPLEALTKGEALAACRNPGLLRKLVPLSVSCAHAENGRWRQESYANCGYCYPCLLRRASLHAVGQDNPEHYRVDVGDPRFLAEGGTRASHLRAIISGASRGTTAEQVLEAGPLPRGRVREFVEVHERGRAELAAWLRAAVPASR